MLYVQRVSRMALSGVLLGISYRMPLNSDADFDIRMTERDGAVDAVRAISRWLCLGMRILEIEKHLTENGKFKRVCILRLFGGGGSG